MFKYSKKNLTTNLNLKNLSPVILTNQNKFTKNIKLIS